MRIGLIGAGRLGKALAERLGTIRLIADVDASKARELAAHCGADAGSSAALFATCEVIFLAVPPQAVAQALSRHAFRLAPGAVVFDLATSVDTASLQCVSIPPGSRLVGLKPIVQAYAFSRGAAAIFVLGPGDRDMQELAARILKPAGSVIVADPGAVRQINAAATRAALRLIHELQVEIASLCPDSRFLRAAVATVAAGTLQDWPPSQPNHYIEDRLRELNLKISRGQLIGLHPALQP